MLRVANVKASCKQKLLNCAAWNADKAKKAWTKFSITRLPIWEKDALRLAAQAERLVQQAEQIR